MENKQFVQSNVNAPQPQKAVERVVYVNQPVEVELTSKVYKRALLRGAALEILGILVAIGFIVLSFFVPPTQPNPFWQYLCVAGAILGVIAFLVGLGMEIWSKVMAWWNNG